MGFSEVDVWTSLSTLSAFESHCKVQNMRRGLTYYLFMVVSHNILTNLPHSGDSTQKDPNGWHSIPGFELPIFGALVSFVHDSLAPYLLACWLYVSLFTSP